MVAAVLLAPAWARADARSEARNKLVQGGEFLKRGEYEPALARFQEAYRLVPSPKIFYNFGLAYRGLGRKADALESFERFLAEAPDAAKDARQIAAREKEQLAGQITLLEVKVDIPGAEVFVDGRSYGTSRTSPIYLDPGPHQLMVEKAGEGPAYTERINATAGQRITVMARLVRGPSAEPSPQPREPTPREPRPTVEPRPDEGTPVPAPAEAGPRWQPVVAWTAAGGAVVALGFGVYQLLEANNRFNEFNGKSDCGENLGNRGGAGCSKLFNDATAARQLSVVGFAVAGVLAATSVVFFVLTPDTPRESSVSMSCGPTLGVPGLSCAGRF
jgi:hypothetical protein